MIFLPDQKMQSEDFLLKLQVMSNELDQYNKKRTKEDIMKECVQIRLDKSSELYLNGIKFSADYLASKKGKYLLRKIKKL